MSDKKEYEIVLLMHPSLSEDQAQEYFTAWIDKEITKEGGSVSKQDFWGRRTLAYPINKETSATYSFAVFSLDGAKLKAMDENIRLDKKIIRHLVTIVPKGEAFMTKEEIDAWNKENLPERNAKKDHEAVVKKAVISATKRKAAAQKAAAPKEKTPKKELNKAELDAKLDEILES